MPHMTCVLERSPDPDGLHEAYNHIPTFFIKINRQYEGEKHHYESEINDYCVEEVVHQNESTPLVTSY